MSSLCVAMKLFLQLYTKTSKPPMSDANAVVGARPTPLQLKLLSQITVGTHLAIYLPVDDEYYPCVVHTHRHGRHTYEIHYDDGYVETVGHADI